MAKYTITFSCGHTGVVQLIGKMSERERKIEYFESQGLCTECWEAERRRRFEDENRKAAEAAAEYGLPELQGSEKQVAWATTIRQQWMDKANGLLQDGREATDKYAVKHPGETDKIMECVEFYDNIEAAIERILLTQTAARHWIDTRGDRIQETLIAAGEEIKAEKTAPPVPQEIRADAMEEMVIRPENPTTSLVAEIRVNDNLIAAHYPERDEEFRLLVRGLGFRWVDGRWQRQTGIKSGPAMDRAVELGVKLIAAGFPVRVYDEALQRRIADAEYEPESTRWVMRHDDMFLVCWNRDDGDFYAAAKALPGARWKSGAGMQAPKEAFREILDFAERYGFRLSPGARDLVDLAQAAFEAAMVADVQGKDVTPQPGAARPVLTPDQVDGEIDADLRDDD